MGSGWAKYSIAANILDVIFFGRPSMPYCEKPMSRLHPHGLEVPGGIDILISFVQSLLRTTSC